MKKIAKPKTVDAYIATAPKEVQVKLKELRAAIRKAAPGAAERISYRMPYYKTHIGLYGPTPIIEEHKSELL